MKRTFKPFFRKRVIGFLSAVIPLAFVFMSRVMHYNYVSNYIDSKKMVLSMSITILVLFVLIILLGAKKIIVSDENIQERSFFHKRIFRYREIDNCIYDSSQKKIMMFINGKVRIIKIVNYDYESVLKELRQHIAIESFYSEVS
jgi:hypothetical protein